MYTGDRLPKVEMITVGLPATLEEDGKGPPSGRPVTRCLDRRVGCPAEAPCNIPPSSASGKPSPQPGSIKKASPKDPLMNLTNYRSAEWRKDLGHILRSNYHYNYPSCKEEEWKKLRTKFFKYLGQRQEEWRTIKEEKLLEYMPYMEHHFHTLTSIRLKGLSQFTG